MVGLAQAPPAAKNDGSLNINRVLVKRGVLKNEEAGIDSGINLLIGSQLCHCCLG